MNESSSASQAYRNDLAREVSSLKSQGKKTEAMSLLEEPRTSRFNAREFDEDILEATQTHGTVSNEPSLYETFPYIKNISGAGLGVGLDQMLDLTVNTRLEEVFIIDLLPAVSLTTKALLEIGRRHRELFGSYPNPKQYLAYFQETNINTTLEMIAGEFDENELEILEQVFNERARSEQNDIKPSNAPLELEYYLRFKSEQKEYKSWLSDEATLQKIISMYENGYIKPILGDLTGSQAMPAIAERLMTEGVPLSLFYFSNVQYYMSESDQITKFWQNIETMPVTDDTVMIRTSVGILERPDSVVNDPWMKKMMKTWTYKIQTLGDWHKQENGEYKAVFDGRTYILSDITDRVSAVSEGASLEEMDVIIPKPGLMIAGLKGF